MFPGANIPYGVAKAVADTDDESNQGGFTANDANITGFSSMHDSGTGGEPSLGNFALFPYASCPGDDIDRCVFPKIARKMHYENDSLKASPGYFTVTLNSGVNAEMTAAQHTSLFRFNFPGATSGNSSSPLILMDLTDLSDSRQDNSTISVDPDTGRMTGGGRFLPSFAQATYAYDAYFCADFHGADIRDNGIFVNSRASASVYDLKISRSINNYPLPGGGWIRFNDASSVLVRVGLSFISSAQACSNAEAEIPSYDFDGVRSAAVDAWRKKLSPIKISTTGVNSSLIKDFYSGIYRAYVNPQNYTGENPKWQSSEPYWDSFYWYVALGPEKSYD